MRISAARAEVADSNPPGALRVWQFRVSRALGRLLTHGAAYLTLGRMPPFVSTSALVVRDGHILTVYDPIRREPVLPGGHLHWREAPQEAVVREVEEETGYRVVLDGLRDVVSGMAEAGEPGVVRVIYEAHVVGGSLRPSAEGVPRWIPVSHAAETMRRDGAIVRRWVELNAAP